MERQEKVHDIKVIDNNVQWQRHNDKRTVN